MKIKTILLPFLCIALIASSASNGTRAAIDHANIPSPLDAFQIPAAQGRYKAGDTLYCYAKSGLVLRDKPSQSGAKLAVVPLGDEVKVIDASPFKIALSVKESCGLEIKGFWVQISYKGKQGFVFDGFLLRQEPINSLMEENYWDQRSKIVSKMNQAPDDGVEYMAYDKAEWENGVKLFFSGYVGGNTTEITFPKTMFTLQEAYLFATVDQAMDPNNPLICECDGAKETIDCVKKDQTGEFHIKRDDNGDIFIMLSYVD